MELTGLRINYLFKLFFNVKFILINITNSSGCWNDLIPKTAHIITNFIPQNNVAKDFNIYKYKLIL